MTLTTIGLSVRDELRVKSMLQLIEGRTSADWIYSDQLAADLAICEPHSPLAQLAMKQAVTRGRPRCVSLLPAAAQPLPNMQCVYAPLKASDFLILLDGTSGAGPTEHAAPISCPPDTTTPAEGTAKAAPLIRALRAAIEHQPLHWHRITVGDTTLFVQPNEDSVWATQKLSPTLIADFLHRHSDVQAQAEDEPAQSGSIDPRLSRHSLKFVLWNCGIQGPADALLPWLSNRSHFGLKRWPDFGRLSHHSWHIRLTAQLLKAPCSIRRMTELANRPLNDIHAFINACALCELLEMSSVTDSEAKSAQAPLPASTNRYAGLFRSIRSALGFGAPST